MLVCATNSQHFVLVVAVYS